MFASALGSTVSQRQASAYRKMDVASVVDSASPHQLVSMLFDGALGAIAEARGAIRSRNIAVKGKAITRAVGIVGEGLRGSLNMDDGGALAGDLDALYRYITLRLTHANLKNDEAALEECTGLIESLRAGWVQIADRVPA